MHAPAGDMTNRDMTVANMLSTMIEALEQTGSPLQHVFFAEVALFSAMCFMSQHAVLHQGC